MNVIILGCTQVGISLATDLAKTGHDVAVIDRDANKFCDLPAFFKGLTVEGVAMDVSVLEKAGILECDAFAAVTEDDQMGMTVVIRHEGGYTTRYSSLSADVAVSAGQDVAMGQTIGTVGTTALMENALGDHVHFTVLKNDAPVDPMEFLK